MTTRHTIHTNITEDVTINVPAQFATVEAALDSLMNKFIQRGATVTISVAAGIYYYSSPVVWYHPQAERIIITGDSSVATTITGNSTISGTAGDWHEIISVTTTTGMSAGDYVAISGLTYTSGSTAPAGAGFHQIYSVDSATQITIINKNLYASYSTLPKNLYAGAIKKLGTIFSFSGCDGIKINSPFKEISYIGVIGNNTLDTSGIIVGGALQGTNLEDVTENPLLGYAYLNNIGVSGFGDLSAPIGLKNSGLSICGTSPTLKIICVSNCNTGISFGFNSNPALCSYIYCNGNMFGITLRHASFIDADVISTSCNVSIGTLVQYSSKYSLLSHIYAIANSYGIYCGYSSSMFFNNYSYMIYNSAQGIQMTSCSRCWLRNNGVLNNNGGHDVYADYMSRIDVQGATSFSPAARTLGNYNSYIYNV